MLDDALKISGRVQLELLDETGQLKEVREVDNLVTTGGKGVIAARMLAAQALAAMNTMATGTGGTAPVVGNTTLQAENGRIGLAGTSTAGAVITYTCSFGPGLCTGALQEAGIFNDTVANGGGIMLCRTTFATINKAAGDTLNVSWTVTIG